MVTSGFITVPWFLQGAVVLWILLKVTLPVAANSGVGPGGKLLTAIFCFAAAAAFVPLLLWAVFAGQILTGAAAIVLAIAPFCCVSICASAATARKSDEVQAGEDGPSEGEPPPKI